MTTATAVTLDRELVERFIVEVDAIGIFDAIRNNRQETSLETHVYEILEPFERAALGRMSDEAAQELHERARARAQELAREWFGYLFAGVDDA